MKVGDLVRHLSDDDHGLIVDCKPDAPFPYLVWWYDAFEGIGPCWMTGPSMEVVSGSR